MKFYVLLAVATVVIITSFFYMKHQEAQKAQAAQVAAAAQLQLKNQQTSQTKAQAAEQARMEQSARLAEQEEAMLAAGGNDTSASGTKLQGSKRVKVVFNGKGPSKQGVRKTYDHFDDSYIAGNDDGEGFKYSSAQYSHRKEKAERVSRAGEMSDDLLIVEGRLEDRVQRANQ